MIKNHLKFAWRNLMKDRRFTLLNLLGLSSGLTCALLIYIWVEDEVKVDKFLANDERLFQVMENRLQAGGIWTAQSSPIPMAATLAKEVPEVEFACMVAPLGNITLSVNNEKNLRSDGKVASPDYFKMFSYKLLEGNSSLVLLNPNAIVLSDILAQKLFGRANGLIGKQVEFQHEKTYVVSGVFADAGPQSSDRFDFVTSALGWERYLNNSDTWGNTGNYSYVMLRRGMSAATVNRRIAGLIKRKTNNEIIYRTPFLARYSDYYLHGHYEDGKLVGGRIDYVRLFSIIAIFILVIACVNFMNLSTAKASGRAKEVGIKKSIGAERGSLVFQFLGESILMAFAALLLAVLLVVLLLPAFNGITGKQLSLTHPPPSLLLAAFGITLFAGLVAGSYPALYLSGFRPVQVLKGTIRGSAAEMFVRKGLVVFQFSLSIILIVAVLVVYRQIHLIQTKNLGYDRARVISFYKDGKMGDSRTAETFLDETRRIPGVLEAGSIGSSLTGHSSGTSGVVWPGKEPRDKTEFEDVAVDYDLLKTLDIKIKEGRSFSKSYPADTAAIIFNEAGIAYMGLKNAVGKQVTLWDQKMEIVGVVKDFHFQSLHEKVKPLYFRLNPSDAYRFMIKMEDGKENTAVAKLQALYLKMNPGFSFNYRFLDENYQKLYAAEMRVAILSRYFAGLAILISCLGLFGLAAFTAQRRSKEISIRKVLGATLTGIVMLLSADFLKLIVVSIVIAFPLAWWATSKWLDGFAYRIPVGAGVFVAAAVSIIFITFLTISFQALRAALANPVKSLQSE